MKFLFLAVVVVVVADELPAGSGDNQLVYSFSLDVDNVKLTEHLKCTSCLANCDKVRRSSVSYYFCLVCLEECGSNEDALLHHFVTRSCSSIPDAGPETPVQLPTQVLAEMLWPDDVTQQQTNEDSFLDEYMEREFFEESVPQPKSVNSNNCKKNDELRKKYENVNEQLGSCLNQLQKLTVPQSEHFIVDSEGQTIPETYDDYVANDSVVTEEQEIMRIIESKMSYFTKLEEVKEVLNKPLSDLPDKKLAILKVAPVRKPFEVLACRTELMAVNPLKAEHISGRHQVSLLSARSYIQLFFRGSCESKMPVVSTVPTSTCKVVHNVHKAIILVTEEQYKDEAAGFLNCDFRKSAGVYVCDDWVNIPGQCQLYLDV